MTRVRTQRTWIYLTCWAFGVLLGLMAGAALAAEEPASTVQQESSSGMW